MARIASQTSNVDLWLPITGSIDNLSTLVLVKKIVLISCLLMMTAFLIYQESVMAAHIARVENSKLPPQSPAKPHLASTPDFSWKGFIATWLPSETQEDLGALLKQRAVLASMNRDRLLEGLDQLPQLDLDEELEDELRFAILTFLASLDPFTTLKLAESLPNQNSWKVVNFKLNTFKFLAGEDVAKATTWLDQQINDESIEAKHISQFQDPRFKFEKVLISKLLNSNFAEAQARVSLLSEQEKQYLFQSHADLWLQGDRVPEAFLELARSNSPTGASAHIIGEVLGAQKVASLAEATTLLDQSKLSDAERSATAKSLLLNHIGRDHRPPDLEAIYQWTLNENEGRRTHLMTSVFNQLGPSQPSTFTLKTEELVSGVFSLVDTTGNQDILDNFLENRSGTIGQSLEREIDSFKDQDLAKRFRAALQR
ncbi:MAG: hypothetical protein ABF391_07725 [Akkermansiaceae bacterium]